MSGSPIWPVSIVTVEQLNRSQRHAQHPNGRAGGVSDWVSVMSGALFYAAAHGAGVESTDLDGSHLVLVLPEVVR